MMFLDIREPMWRPRKLIMPRVIAVVTFERNTYTARSAHKSFA